MVKWTIIAALALTTPALADSPAARCKGERFTRVQSMLDEVKKRHPALRWHVLTGEAVKQLIDQYNSTPPVSNVVADAIMVADVDPDAPQVSITTALRNCVLMSEWINRGQWEATIEHLFGEPSEPLKEDPS